MRTKPTDEQRRRLIDKINGRRPATPTERVNAAIISPDGNWMSNMVCASFAYTLAGELEAAQARVKELEQENGALSFQQAGFERDLSDAKQSITYYRQMAAQYGLDAKNLRECLAQSESGAAALRDLLRAVTTHEFDEATFNDVIVDGSKMNWFDARDKALNAASATLDGPEAFPVSAGATPPGGTDAAP